MNTVNVTRVLLAFALCVATACGDDDPVERLTCGDGTAEVDGQCQAISVEPAECVVSSDQSSVTCGEQTVVIERPEQFVENDLVLSGLSGFDDYADVLVVSGTLTLRGAISGARSLAIRAVGGLRIEDTDLGDLTVLNQITAVAGPLEVIANESLESLAGLEGVESTTELSIQLNPQLTSLAGLAGLVSTGAGILLNDLPALSDAEALAGVRRPGLVSLSDLPSRPSFEINGFEGLSAFRIAGTMAPSLSLTVPATPQSVQIIGTRNLERLELTSSLELGQVLVWDNEDLKELVGKKMGDSLSVLFNRALESVSLGRLDDFSISGDSIVSFELEGFVGQDARIWSAALESLAVLDDQSRFQSLDDFDVFAGQMTCAQILDSAYDTSITGEQPGTWPQNWRGIGMDGSCNE